MYKCHNCNEHFTTPEVYTERYNLDTPPYDKISKCPACGSVNFEVLKPTYCANCGVPIAEGESYCSDICRKLGEAARERERECRRIVHDFDVSRAIREVDAYNKKHGTNYSYGRYFALKGMGKLNDEE